MTSSHFNSYEAATGKPLPGEYCEATADQINSACEAAKRAFDFLQDRDEKVRAELLSLVADRMQSERDAIVKRCQLETGYLQQRVEGEFDRAVGQLHLFARLTRERVWDVRTSDPADPDRQPIAKPSMDRRFVPLGPIAVFGACNFPLAISVVGNDFVAAIAVGCPVVVKSHPSHVGTCDLLGKVVTDAVDELGLPPGMFTLLHGRENKTAVDLVQHPLIAGVGFTGSPVGGRALAAAILDRHQPIPIFAELGSSNPVFLAPDAITKNADSIASGFASSLCLGNGHMCTKPGVVVAAESLLDSFVKATTDILSQQTTLPLLSESVAKNFDSGIDQLKHTPGVKTLVENNTQAAGPWHRGPHWFLVDAKSAIKHDLLSFEIFGPVSLLVHCQNTEEMLRIAEHYTGSLTTTIHSTDQDESFEAEWRKQATRFAGRIIRNGWPTGMEIGPATHHGGPYPASLDGRSTSVGYASLERFIRPVCFQDFPMS